MNAKGRVKEDSSLRGMSYHARRDARRTTHDAQPTTHTPTACSRAPRARSGSKAPPRKSTISWVYYILGSKSGAEFPPRKMLHDI